MIKKLIVFITILATVLTSCTNKPLLTDNPKPVSFDLDSIIRRGKLIAVTDFNSTNYFIYKGEPMGFHYELLKEFTDHLGIDLEIITENHLDHAMSILNSGQADLVAIGLTVNSSRKKDILFSAPILETRQVLVQRKPHNWRYMTEDEIGHRLIRNQLDLAGKAIYVQEKSSHFDRLRTLESEIGDTINIISVPYESEELIRNVVKGNIDYTICDENVAVVNQIYYPDLDISTPVSFPQNIAWGLRTSGSQKLQNELDKWISGYRRTASYAFLYAKYFKNPTLAEMIRSDYYSLSTGKISRWDDIIKNASRDINWDWRLLASLICQESHFNPDVESYAGAVGLMQVMPYTGKSLGVDINSPVNNIKAGTMYIKNLQEIFAGRITDREERTKFILASYNAGPGHVLDAMRLAEKHGLNPQKWDGNVAECLLRKSKPEYYNDTVCKNGYFIGNESVNFVTEILDRYDHYRNIIQDRPINLSLNSR